MKRFGFPQLLHNPNDPFTTLTRRGPTGDLTMQDVAHRQTLAETGNTITTAREAANPAPPPPVVPDLSGGRNFFAPQTDPMLDMASQMTAGIPRTLDLPGAPELAGFTAPELASVRAPTLADSGRSVRSPDAPTPRPAASMPTLAGVVSRAAAQRVVESIASRAGRASTMLTTPETRPAPRRATRPTLAGGSPYSRVTRG